MSVFVELIAQHRALAPAIDDLRALIGSDRGAGEDVASVRWALCRQLIDHFTQEDQRVCARLYASGNVEAIRATMRFHAQEEVMIADLMQYQREWPVGRIVDEWDRFRGETQAILDSVERRMAFSESEIYPQFRRLLARTGDAHSVAG